MKPLIERLTQIRNDLIKVATETPRIAGTADLQLTRMLDSIAENAVFLRGVIEHGVSADGYQRVPSVRLMKRVRKALGYTYP